MNTPQCRPIGKCSSLEHKPFLGRQPTPNGLKTYHKEAFFPINSSYTKKRLVEFGQSTSLLLNLTHSNKSSCAFKNNVIQLVFRNMVCQSYWHIWISRILTILEKRLSPLLPYVQVTFMENTT
jgi:hypothetical protein